MMWTINLSCGVLFVVVYVVFFPFFLFPVSVFSSGAHSRAGLHLCSLAMLLIGSLRLLLACYHFFPDSAELTERTHSSQFVALIKSMIILQQVCGGGMSSRGSFSNLCTGSIICTDEALFLDRKGLLCLFLFSEVEISQVGFVVLIFQLFGRTTSSCPPPHLENLCNVLSQG